MQYNLGFNDIIIRWVLMIIIGIVGGLMHVTWLMLLSIPLFLTGMLAWDPIYAMMGKSTRDKVEEHSN